MKAHTHATTGVVLGLAGINFGLFSFLALPMGHGFLTLTLLASLLPDIDHHSSKMGRKLPIISHLIEFVFGHRGVLHSLWGVAIFSGLTWLVCSMFSIGAWKLIVFAVGFGYFTHLVSDSFTKMGIKWLYPFETGHVKGPVTTGELSEMIFFIVIILVMGVFLGRMGWSILNFI